jgi:hypothetical protein
MQGEGFKVKLAQPKNEGGGTRSRMVPVVEPVETSGTRYRVQGIGRRTSYTQHLAPSTKIEGFKVQGDPCG